MRMATVLLLALALLAPPSGARAARTDDSPPPLVAVFPVEVVDTSGEPPNPQWPERITAVTHAFASQLAGSGRYRTVELQPADSPVHTCEACWRDPARKAGADAAAIAVIHKMSTLIASLHVWVVDVGTKQLLRQGAVSLRGDSEEAWRRAVDFLLRRGILNPDPEHPMLSSPFPGG
jgi:hypothetical protein